ncbi:MAG: hypothetical protein AAF985_02210 [Bacteroidota bacterium]
MEDIQTLDDNFAPELTLSAQIRDCLKEAAKWSKFLAIVLFVYVGFLVLALLGLLFGIGALVGELGMGAGFMGIFAFLLLLFIVLITVPTLFLYRFATRMQGALRRDDQNQLFDSFSNLKSYYKFWGILVAVFLGIYALFIVANILLGGLGAVVG